MTTVKSDHFFIIYELAFLFYRQSEDTSVDVQISFLASLVNIWTILWNQLSASMRDGI